MQRSKWTKDQVGIGQPISAKHLISQRGSSKPFFNKAIIEEVTKEHFFTKQGDNTTGRRRSSAAGESASSFASIVPSGGAGGHARNIRLRPGGGPQPGAFQKRSQSLPGVKPADKIKLDIPSEAKVLCFCK